MRLRFLPLEIFALIEWGVIVSLHYAPGPWMTGFGGYTDSVVILSTLIGTTLTLLLLLSVLNKTPRFSVFLVINAVIGLFCLGLAAFGLQGAPVRLIFTFYSFALIGNSLFVKIPKQQQAVAPPVAADDHVTMLGTRGKRQDRKKAA